MASVPEGRGRLLASHPWTAEAARSPNLVSSIKTVMPLTVLPPGAGWSPRFWVRLENTGSLGVSLGEGPPGKKRIQAFALVSSAAWHSGADAFHGHYASLRHLNFIPTGVTGRKAAIFRVRVETS